MTAAKFHATSRPYVVERAATHQSPPRKRPLLWLAPILDFKTHARR